ncbi:hypothetical protein GUITHDRAFT_108698 [Guillardia theta CCMP2712]|uniref:Cadherin domain-containing protein n=1 Tax=Guillardia theta (strain CCMP2712) TaxID=905079 RepID=L1JA84_GUITC|nr:hypothetical protein GUITHDRAFT_108698 [Guillardia theta CCMP2712]EKX45431.1 hypothetical protein GUITHDRAFT_108698 [Guillardia theta CCMP2712]|eukprot:XP_005832411.1 hypothetical protein GUITHDRAFT_108698 [Guillardia theta CCMP2712]
MKKVSNRRYRYLAAAALILLLLAGIAIFVVFTLPKKDMMLHPQGIVLHVASERDAIVFNATATAPSQASMLHDIQFESAICNVSFLSATYYWLHLVQINIDGPVQVMGQSSDSQSLRGGVNVTDVDFSQFMSWHGALLRLKVECFLEVKADLYWGLYQKTQTRNLTKFLSYEMGKISRRSTDSQSLASVLNLALNLFQAEDLKDFASMFVVPKEEIALILKPRLPLIFDSSGLISAVYVHVPEISFDIGAEAFYGTESQFQESSSKQPNGVVRIGTLPTQWLLISQKGNGSTHLDQISRTRANFFITCAHGKCNSSSIRPIVQVFTNYLTTHPVSGISVTFLTSGSSSALFRNLLGSRNSFFIKLYPVQTNFHRKMHPRSGWVGNQNLNCFEADFVQRWRLQVCGSLENNLISEQKIPNFSFLFDPHKLPSLEITFADISYFLSGQGDPVIYGHANVAEFTKIDLVRAYELIGFNAGQSQPYLDVLDDSLSLICALDVEVGSTVLVKHSLEVDIGIASKTGTGSLEGSSILFAIVRLVDSQGTMNWEWVNTAARRQLNKVDQLFLLPLNWTLSSKMQTSSQDWYMADAALLAREVREMGKIEGLASVSFSIGDSTILDGSIDGGLVLRNDEISINLIAKDRKDRKEKFRVTLFLGDNKPGNNGFEGIFLLADIRWENRSLLKTDTSLSFILPGQGSVDLQGKINFELNSHRLLNWNIHAGASWPQMSLLDGNFGAVLNVEDNNHKLIYFDANLINNLKANLLSMNGDVTLLFQNNKLLHWTGSIAGKYTKTDQYTPIPSSSSTEAGTTFDDVTQREELLAANYSTSLGLGPLAGGGSLESSGGLTFSTYYHQIRACSSSCSYGSCWSSCDEPKTERKLHLAPGLVALWNQKKKIDMTMTLDGATLNEALDGSSVLHVGYDSEPLVDWTGSIAGKYTKTDQYTPWPSSSSTEAGTTFDDVTQREELLAANYSTSLGLGPLAGGGSLESSGGLTFSTYYHQIRACSLSCSSGSCWPSCDEPKTERKLHLAPGLVALWNQKRQVDIEMSLNGVVSDARLAGSSSLNALIGSNNLVGFANASGDCLGWSCLPSEIHLSSSWAESKLTSIDLVIQGLLSRGWDYAHGSVLASLWIGERHWFALDVCGDLRELVMLKPGGMVKLISRAALLGNELIDLSLIAEYDVRGKGLNANMTVTNLLTISNRQLYAIAAEGSYSLNAGPYGVTARLRKDGEENFLLIGRGDYDWNSEQRLLNGSITTILIIPHTPVKVDLDHIVTLSLGNGGKYAGAVDVLERRGAPLGFLVPSFPSLLHVKASAVLRDMPDNTPASFLKRFALATAGLDVAMSVAVSGKTAVVVTALVESDGDMRGDETRMSCLEVDLGFHGPLWITLYGDLRSTRFSLPWALESSKNYEALTALLQYILVSWRINNLIDSVQDWNGLYKNQVPQCDVSSAGKLLITLGDLPHPAWPPKATGMPNAADVISTTPEPTYAMPSQEPMATNISTTSVYIPSSEKSVTFFVLKLPFLTTDEDSKKLDFVTSVATNISYVSSQGFFQCAMIESSNNLFKVTPSLDLNGSLHLQLEGNASGDAFWNISLVDGDRTHYSPIPLHIVVRPVNDPPSFVVASQLLLLLDLGSNLVPNALRNISLGAPDEDLSQNISFSVTFLGGPQNLLLNTLAISPSGTLSFNATSLGTGLTTFSVVARDDGGTMNGGVNVSTKQALKLAVVSRPRSVFDVVLTQISLNRVSIQWSYKDPGQDFEAAQYHFNVSGRYARASSGSYYGFERMENLTVCLGVCSIVLDDVLPKSTLAVTITAVNIAGKSPEQNRSIVLEDKNVAPTFSINSTFVRLEDAGLVTIGGAAYDISAGSLDEVQQKLTFIVSSSSPAAFTRLPSIDPTNGSLTFQTALNVNGNFNCTVLLVDDGGTRFGGVNVSQQHSFVIKVVPVNDAPSFLLKQPVITLLEDAGLYVYTGLANSISSGPSDESWQSLTFSMTWTGGADVGIFQVAPSLNQSGTLMLKANPNMSGTSNWTIQLHDNGGEDNNGQAWSATRTLQIIIVPVNDPPSFVVASQLLLLLDLGSNLVPNALRNISLGAPDEDLSQNISFSVTFLGGPQNLLLNTLAISPSGTLSFHATSLGTGLTTFSVVARDDGGTMNGGVNVSTKQALKLAVVSRPRSVFDVVLTQISLNRVSIQWSYKDPGQDFEAAQYHFNVSGRYARASSGSYYGFERMENLTVCLGVCSIVLDDVLPKSTLAVTITAVNIAGKSPEQNRSIVLEDKNVAPTFSINSTFVRLEDAGLVTIGGAAYDISAGSLDEVQQKLTFIVSSSSPAAFTRLPSIDPTNGSLTFQTALNVNGNFNCTVLLVDDGGTRFGGVNVSQQHSFVIKVVPVNDAPSFLLKQPVITLLEDAGLYVYTGLANSISSGPSDESWQSLTFSMTWTGGADVGIFQVAPSLNQSGTLMLKANPNMSGTSNWTIQLHDNGGEDNNGQAWSATRTLQIIIVPVNDPPSFVVASQLLLLLDLGSNLVPNALRNISLGAPDEDLSQNISFSVTFLGGPQNLLLNTLAISPSGTLSFNATSLGTGLTTFSVVARDDGGTMNGGVNVSTKQALKLAVVSRPRSVFDVVLTQISLNRVSIQWSYKDPGQDFEAAQYHFNVSGRYARASSGSYYGFERMENLTVCLGVCSIVLDDVLPKSTLAVTITAVNIAGKSPEQNRSIVLEDKNVAPTFSIVSTFVRLEDAGLVTIGGAAYDISAGSLDEVQQKLTFIVSSSSPAAFTRLPSIDPTNGSLTFQTALNVNGNFTARFLLKQPVITLLEDAGLYVYTGLANSISSGPSDESWQSLTFSMTWTGGADVGIFQVAPSLNQSGTLMLKANPNMSGTSNWTIQLHDNGGEDNNGQAWSATRTLQIIIVPVNDPPSFSMIGSLTVYQRVGIISSSIAWDISAGPPDESKQNMTFEMDLLSGRSDLFSEFPRIDQQGLLTFSRTTGTFGRSDWKVSLRDDGGVLNGGISSSSKVFTMVLIGIPSPVFNIQYQQPRNGFVLITWNHSDFSLTRQELGETYNSARSFLVSFTECRSSCILTATVLVKSSECSKICNVTMQLAIGVTYSVSIVAQNEAGQALPVLANVFLPDLTPKLEYLSVSSGDVSLATLCTVAISNFQESASSKYLIRINDIKPLPVVDLFFVAATASTAPKVTLSFNIPPWNTTSIVNISVGLIAAPDVRVIFPFEYFSSSVPRVSLVFPTMASTAGGDLVRITVSNVFESNPDTSAWLFNLGNTSFHPTSAVSISQSEVSLIGQIPPQAQFTSVATIDVHLLYKQVKMSFLLQMQPPCNYRVFCPAAKSSYLANDYLLKFDPPMTTSCDMKYCLDSSTFTAMRLISSSPSTGSTKGGSPVLISIASDTLISAYSGGLKLLYNGVPLAITVVSTIRLTSMNFTLPQYVSPCCCGRNYTCVSTFQVVDLLTTRSLSIPFEFIADIEGPPNIVSIYPGCTSSRPDSCTSSPVLTLQRSSILLDLENFPKIETQGGIQVYIDFSVDPNATVTVLSSTNALTKMNISFVTPASSGIFTGRIWAAGYEKSNSFQIYVQSPPNPQVLSYFPSKFVEGDSIQIQAQLSDWSSYFDLSNVEAVSSTNQTHPAEFKLLLGATLGSATLKVSFVARLTSSEYQLRIQVRRVANQETFSIPLNFQVSANPYIGYVFPSSGQVLTRTRVNVVVYNSFSIANSQLFASFEGQIVTVTDVGQQGTQNTSSRFLTFLTPNVSSVGTIKFCITSNQNQCGGLTSQFQFMAPAPLASRRASSQGGTNIFISFYGTNDDLKVYAFLPSRLSGVVKSELKATRTSTCTDQTFCTQQVAIEAPVSSDGSDVLLQLENGKLSPQNLAISYFLMPSIISVNPTQSSVMGGDSVQISMKNFPAISTALDVSVVFDSQQARVMQVLGYNDFICVSPSHKSVGSIQLSIIPTKIANAQEKADMTVTSQFSYSRPDSKVLSMIPSRGSLKGGAIVTMIFSHFPTKLTETDVSVVFSSKQQATVNRVVQSDSFSGESIVEFLMPALPVGLQQATLTVSDGYNSTAALFFESYDATVQLTCNRLQMQSLDDPIKVTGGCQGGVDGTDFLLIAVTNIGQIQSFSGLAISFGTEYAVMGKLVNSTMQKTFVIVAVPANSFFSKSTVIDLSVTNAKTMAGMSTLQGSGKFEYIAAPSVLSASFDAMGSSIMIVFSESTNIFSLPVAQLSTCQSFLEIGTSQPFGKSAKCTWQDEQTLSIILSYDATVAVNDNLQIKMNLVKHVSGLGPYVSGTVKVASPSILIKPVFQLLGPQEVGPCDDAQIMALGTSSRPLTFSWTCMGCPDVIQSKLAVTVSDKIVISSSDLAQSQSSYRIQVYGVNFLGTKSETLSLQFYRTSLPIPVVSLSGFDLYKKSDDILLGAQTAFSKCSEEMELQFKWEQVNQDNAATNNGIPASVLARNSPTFFLSKGTLAVPGLYKLKLTVTLPTTPPTQTAVSTSFTLLASDLIAIVKNGDSKIGRSQKLSLDAGDSKDPDYRGSSPDVNLKFTWTCKVQGMMCRDRKSNNPLVFDSSSVLSMSSDGFEVNVQYIFSLEVMKDSRSASTSVSMVFVEEFVPLTTLTSPSTMLVKGENVLNPLQTLNLLEYSCTSCSSYKWQLIDQGTATVLPATTNELFLSSSTFVQGRRYTVLLTSYQSPQEGQVCNGLCQGSASFEFRVNLAPSGGQCSVQPTQGYELNTQFVVQCGSFSDADLPLSFQFNYKVKNGTEASLAPSSSPMRSLYLPSGEINISVIAIDSLGAQSTYFLDLVVVLPIPSVSPVVAQQALDSFVLLGKTSEFSNYAISLTQKLSRDSSTLLARRRRAAASLRVNDVQLSESALIRSNTTLSLLRIIEKQVPSAGNLLENIGTLFFLVNSSEPLTMDATVAAVEILSNTTILIPQVLQYSLERTTVQTIIFIASTLKDQLQQSVLSMSEKTRCMSMLVTSAATAMYHGIFDFIDIKNNLVCDHTCVPTTDHIFTYKWKSAFTKILHPQDIAVESLFMLANISAGSSAVVPASSEQSASFYTFMYVWRTPLATNTDTFISDSHGFILGISDLNGVRNSVSQFDYDARIPVSQSDLSSILWNCVMWKQGWSSETCSPVGFSPNIAQCSCKETGLVAVSVSSVSVCGDGRVTGKEECDDGNRVSQDGCSQSCTLESGFTCQPGNSILRTRCVNSSSTTTACKPQMLGPHCETLCLGEVVGDSCTAETLTPLLVQPAVVVGSLGGQVSLASWGNLTFPKDFYGSTLDMTVKLYAGVPLASGSSVGPTLVLEPTGATFLKPLTLSLSTSHVTDLVAQPVALYYLNSLTKQWEYVESRVDVQQNLLTAQILHFSVYAVLRKPPENQSPSPKEAAPPPPAASSTPPGTTKDTKSSKVPVIVGVTVSCGVVALVAAGLFAYYRRRIAEKLKEGASPAVTPAPEPANTQENQVNDEGLEPYLESPMADASSRSSSSEDDEEIGRDRGDTDRPHLDAIPPGHVAQMVEKQNRLVLESSKTDSEEKRPQKLKSSLEYQDKVNDEDKDKGDEDKEEDKGEEEDNKEEGEGEGDYDKKGEGEGDYDKKGEGEGDYDKKGEGEGDDDKKGEGEGDDDKKGEGEGDDDKKGEGEEKDHKERQEKPAGETSPEQQEQQEQLPPLVSTSKEATAEAMEGSHQPEPAALPVEHDQELRVMSYSLVFAEPQRSLGPWGLDGPHNC